MRAHPSRPRLRAVPDLGTADPGSDEDAGPTDEDAAGRVPTGDDLYQGLHPIRSAVTAPARSAIGTATAVRATGTAAASRSAVTTPAPRRLTPYESGLAAVARQDIHIERVWPMRSPPTALLGESSSASFQSERRGTPPAAVVAVGGLRMNQAFSHQPVMVSEVVDLLGPVPAGLVVDATLGGAGHTRALLDAHPHLSVLGIDRDPTAVAAASSALAHFGDRAVVRQARFDELAHVVEEARSHTEVGAGRSRLSGVLFDLGVSSPQLDVAARGFSYQRDAPLDMRMDPTGGRTAADVVNELDEAELAELFAANGEGRFARRIARAVVAARPLTTTGQLSDVVKAAIPAATRRSGGHPARRVFQAVRIAVNEELAQLPVALSAALDLLSPGGRCVVISYHSGEDRLVKDIFTREVTGGCVCPPGLPCVCGAEPRVRLVVRGAKRATEEEIGRNRRAEAARLRVVERLPASERRSANGEVA